MIRFKCPNCDTVLQVSREYAGQAVLCPTCNTQLITPQTPVPEPSLEAADPGQIICICGQCKSTYKIPASSAGRQVPCPKCGHTAQIPEDDQVVTESNTMRFTCPTCRQSYCVLSKYAGKKFDCLACQRPCMIPHPQQQDAEDLLMLEPDDTPEEQAPPPPTEQEAAPDQGLSFRLQMDEESEEVVSDTDEPPQIDMDELSLLPAEPEAAAAPPPRPAGKAPPPEKPKKTKQKSSGSAVKIIGGIAGAVFGFVIGFLIVYNLVRPDRSETDIETDTSPAAQQTEVAQTPEAIEFAESVVRRLNQNPADIGELKYEIPDEVYVTDPTIQSLVSAMDIGPLSDMNSAVEASRREIGASHYIVRTLVTSSTGQTREVMIAFFEIMETDPDTFYSEMEYWIFGITITDESGTVLASVGLQDNEMLTAQMDEPVDEHSLGITEEELEGFARIGAIILGYMCIMLIVFFMVRLVVMLCQAVVLANNGEPGWAILIPVQRQIALCRVAEKDEWMGWLCGLAEFIFLFNFFLGLVPPLLLLACLLIYILFTFIFSLGIAKAHGRGIGFGLGLFFIPIIFYPILIFSGKAYE